MRFANAQKLLFAALLPIVGLVGCRTSTATDAGSGEIRAVQFLTNTSDIATVQTASKVNTNVSLRGKVGDRAPLLGGTAYALQDATGSIWVVTKATAPKPGDTVTAQGILRYQSIQLNGQEQGQFYVEQQG